MKEFKKGDVVDVDVMDETRTAWVLGTQQGMYKLQIRTSGQIVYRNPEDIFELEPYTLGRGKKKVTLLRRKKQ